MAQRQKTLYAAAFFMEIYYGLFLLVAAVIAATVIDSPLLLGLTGTVHMVIRVITNPLSGFISDRLRSRKPLIYLALVFCGISLLMLLPGSTLMVFGAYLVAGAGAAIFFPQMEAWLAYDHQGGHLIKSLGCYGVCISIGLALGSLAGGVFAGIAAYGFAIFGGAILAVLACLIAITREETATAGSGAMAPAPSIPAGGARYLFLGWTANLATWIGIGLIRFLFPKLCLTLGIPKAGIGAFNTAMNIGWGLMFYLLARFRGWTYRFAPLAGMQTVGILAVLLMWAGRSFLFFPAFVLFGLTTGFTYMSSLFYAQNGAAGRGGRSGLHEMFQSAGMFAGPLLGGALAEAFDLRAPFMFGGAIVLLAIGVERGMLG